MQAVIKSNVWIPKFFDDLFLDSRLDSVNNNYEIFSTPALNIIENIPNFVVELAAPGFDKKDFKIEVEEEVLKISAKTSVQSKETDDSSRFITREFNYKEFERSFKLPEEVQKDEILANYENGVLKITLPKAEQKKAFKRMVEIS